VENPSQALRAKAGHAEPCRKKVSDRNMLGLSIIAVFLEYLRQLLIDLHQIYRHSSVPKNTSPCIFPAS